MKLTKQEKRILELSVQFAIGYMSGKHNLKTTKKERKKVAINFYKELTLGKWKNRTIVTEQTRLITFKKQSNE